MQAHTDLMTASKEGGAGERRMGVSTSWLVASMRFLDGVLQPDLQRILIVDGARRAWGLARYTELDEQYGARGDRCTRLTAAAGGGATINGRGSRDPPPGCLLGGADPRRDAGFANSTRSRRDAACRRQVDAGNCCPASLRRTDGGCWTL